MLKDIFVRAASIVIGLFIFLAIASTIHSCSVEYKPPVQQPQHKTT